MFRPTTIKINPTKIRPLPLLSQPKLANFNKNMANMTNIIHREKHQVHYKRPGTQTFSVVNRKLYSENVKLVYKCKDIINQKYSECDNLTKSIQTPVGEMTDANSRLKKLIEELTKNGVIEQKMINQNTPKDEFDANLYDAQCALLVSYMCVLVCIAFFGFSSTLLHYY